MLEFVIACSVYGVIFFPVIMVLLIKEPDKRLKLQVGAGIVAFWLFLSLITTLTYFKDENDWNNGLCTECKGEYNFSGATGYRISHHYYYTCDNCGHTIETQTLME